ncbi:MAG: RluA family pseudouridine synthase [Firmicutes bacterium]|nr:RluA family pseudouridine synthase [Bacillota bacterium]
MTAREKLPGRVYRLRVRPSQKGQRLDVFLAATLGPDLSRSQLQELIKTSRVRVDGRKPKASLRLCGQEKIIIEIPPPQKKLKIVPEAKPLTVIYEDEYILVINKPAGMVVHPAPGHTRGTLVNVLLAHCGEELAGVGNKLRPGIVHRLDKDTSGLMVVAKTNTAYERLTLALKERAVKRSYFCLAHGSFKSDYNIVNAPIGRHPKMRLKMAVVADGRPARTYFKVLERLANYSYIKASLDTGRTHQIRVHLASIAHPVVGDPLYGRRRGNLGLTRQFLHAAELGFVHPITKEQLEFTSTLPADLKAVLERLQDKQI